MGTMPEVTRGRRWASQKKKKVSVAVPPAPVRVPSQVSVCVCLMVCANFRMDFFKLQSIFKIMLSNKRS